MLPYVTFSESTRCREPFYGLGSFTAQSSACAGFVGVHVEHAKSCCDPTFEQPDLLECWDELHLPLQASDRIFSDVLWRFTMSYPNFYHLGSLRTSEIPRCSGFSREPKMYRNMSHRSKVQLIVMWSWENVGDIS